MTKFEIIEAIVRGEVLRRQEKSLDELVTLVSDASDFDGRNREVAFLSIYFSLLKPNKKGVLSWLENHTSGDQGITLDEQSQMVSEIYPIQPQKEQNNWLLNLLRVFLTLWKGKSPKQLTSS